MISLPVKYRPTIFEDVTEQESIITILKNQIKNNSVKNCMLFAGMSGSGKTTCARIFANTLGAQIIEIDAASNNGVDNIRNIIIESQERSVSNKYKTYIVDECHQLSNAAWNAMLKLIEEPPMYTIFIFCTTDPQKIPLTISNRVQRFNFKKISSKGIFNRLVHICNMENFSYEEDALDYISKIANGSMRESLSLLGQITDYSHLINMDNINKVLGTYGYENFIKMANSILDGNEREVINLFNEYENYGNDLKLFVEQYFEFTLNLVKYSLFKDISIINLPNIYVNELDNLTNFDNPDKYYNYILDRLLNLKNMLKNDSNISTTILAVLLQVTRCQ